jgi:Flp pilus assembly pilin Flp
MTKLLKAFAAALSGATPVECAFVAGLVSIGCILAWDYLGSPL